MSEEAPPERVTFFRLPVYQRVGNSRVVTFEGRKNLSFKYLKGPVMKMFRKESVLVTKPVDSVFHAL